MLKPLMFVIAMGVGIGLAWPGGRPAQVNAAAAVTPGEPRETILERERNGHFYVHAGVNGELVRFLVDTGASGVALTEADARRVGLSFAPVEYETVGEGASGLVRGKFVTLDRVEVDGKVVEDVEGVILEGSELSLLGQAYLSHVEVQMRGDTMVLR